MPMAVSSNRKFFWVSISCHLIILLVLVLGFDFTTPLPVIENTNKNDVISAVVLGDTEKSKILPQKLSTPTPPPPSMTKKEPTPKPKVQAEKLPQEQIKKEVIALKKMTDKKKIAQQKMSQTKKQKELLAKDLLADVEKVKDEQKKVKQKKLKNQFEKTLHEQAEKSLRQQLLNEEIKLQGTQNRQAQGEVNKYKALILQAISEHWIIPTQANKSLYCELMIRLAPGGTVLDVQITKTSGDPSLDSSARAAVMKASPLPVPNDSAAFDSFREFVLKVKPENILGNEGGLS